MSEIIYPSSSRIGKFNLMYDLLRDGRERPMLQALFGLCVVLETEPHESGRGKTFYAASDLFEPLREGEEIPQYRIEFVCDKPFEQEDWQRRRIESGPFGFVAIRNTIIRVPPATVAVRPHVSKIH